MPSLPRGALLAVAAAVTALLGAAPDATEPAPLVPAGTDPTTAVRPPLVVAGIAGLRWEDVSPELTPTLWGLLDDGASAGGVTIYTSGRPACAAGGWLSLSAGRAVPSSTWGQWCRPLPDVTESGPGATVAGWTDLAEQNLDTLYHPRLGTLGDALADADVCATAVGPGAALALARLDGSVGRYAPVLSSDVFDCPLTVVDLGRTTVLSGVAGERLAVDAALDDLVEQMPSGSDLVITSVSSPAGALLALGVGAVSTERSSGPTGRLLTSPSTRWDGVIRLLDLPSTMTAALGVPEPALFNGSPVILGSERPATAEVVTELAALTSTDRLLRQVSAWFVTGLSILCVVLVGMCALVLRRRRGRAADVGGRTGQAVLQTALLAAGAAPVAAYLMALLPWWRSEGSVWAIWLSIIGIAIVLAVGVQVLTGRRAPIWMPIMLLSGLTVGVLLVDALVGTPLHRLSPLGPTAVTGGRYYGIGNSSFAILGTHAVILCGALAAWALARGQRTAAVLTVAAVGGVTVLVDVGPTWGADLGGGPALLAAFAVLAILVGGARMSWRRVVATAAGAVGVIALISLLDWLRPAAQRSHAGRFVQSMIDGDAWETVSRKATFALATVTNGPVAIITIAVFALLVVVARRPARFAPREVHAALAAWPTFLPTCTALLVVLGIGAVANDYGVRVITIGLAAALPLLAAATLAAAERPTARAAADDQDGGKLPARGSIAGTS